MSRPFIEFIQSQALPWARAGERFRPRVRIKILSRDEVDGAISCLVNYPAGWSDAAGAIDEDEEFFVLQGRLIIGGRAYGPHNYAYLPSGYQHGPMSSPGGAVVLTFLNGKSISGPSGAMLPAGLVEHLDPLTLPWDRTNMDPQIDHLNAWRKNLRLGPDNSGRTYLLAGLPQGYPASGKEPLERHPHVEEMFMISGDMPCSLGVMRAGAYFWRPPGIWHGADCTRNGFLILGRTPGTNVTISEWSDTDHPVTFEPAYRPVLPTGLRSFGMHEQPDPVAY